MKRFLKLKFLGVKQVWVNLDTVREFVLSENSVIIVHNDEHHTEWEYSFSEQQSATRQYFIDKMASLEV